MLLRLSRNSRQAEDAKKDEASPFKKMEIPLSEEQTPSHYIIKIFSPADTDKQIQQAMQKEAQKREEELLKTVIKESVLKKKDTAKHSKRKVKRKATIVYYEEPCTPRSSHQGGISGFDMFAETSNRPKVLIKKYTTVPPEDYTELVEKNQKEVGPLDESTKKEVWKKVGMVSPKFRVNFSSRIQEVPEIETKEPLDEIASPVNTVSSPQQNEMSKTATKFVKKIYSIHNTLPKVKSPVKPPSNPGSISLTQGESSARFKRVSSQGALSIDIRKFSQASVAAPPISEVATSPKSIRDVCQDLNSIYSPRLPPKRYHLLSKINQVPSLDLKNLTQSTLNTSRGHKPNISLKDSSKVCMTTPRQNTERKQEDRGVPSIITKKILKVDTSRDINVKQFSSTTTLSSHRGNRVIVQVTQAKKKIM